MKRLRVLMLTLCLRLASSLLKFNLESCTDMEPYSDPATGTELRASDPASSSMTIDVNSNIFIDGLPLLVVVRAGAGFSFQNLFVSTYCSSCLNPHQFLGTFSVVEGLQLLSCDGNPASAVTRDVNDPTESLSFVWQSREGNTETFFFVATVVYNDTVFWKDLKSDTISPPSTSVSLMKSFAQDLVMLPETEPEVTTEGDADCMMRSGAGVGVQTEIFIYILGVFGILLPAD